jgi:uncharacterized protein YceK
MQSMMWVIIAGLFMTGCATVQTRHAYQGHGYRAPASPKPVCTTVRGNVVHLATCPEERR